jgi:steroid 5-alpha reductase family enzyme
MFFPTWLDMVLLLAAFLWTNYQQMTMLKSLSHSIVRVFSMVFYIAVMLAVVFYNRTDGRLSTVLFVLSVASIGLTIHLYRKVPPQLPEEPKF